MVMRSLISLKARKTTLQAKLEELDQLATVASIDTAELKRQFESRVSDVTALLAKQTVQARQMLRKLLADKIELEPVGSGRERGYKFRGALTVEKLISGEAFAQVKNTSVCGGPISGSVAPVNRQSSSLPGSRSRRQCSDVGVACADRSRR